jgi:hypothetical protein
MAMDDDGIQRDLLLGLEGGDQQALGRAFRALVIEVKPMVVRFEHLSEGESKERVLEVVARLVFPETPLEGRRSKLLATDVELARSGGARGHRRVVVRSFLHDEWRKRRTRQMYEQACASGLSPADIRAARRQRRERRAGPIEDVVQSSGTSGVDHGEAGGAADVTFARALLVKHLPRLKIEYRVAVALEEGFDVAPLLDELAAETGEPVDRVRARVAALRPGDQDARVRVLYPQDEFPDLAKARESYRKRHERGQKELIERIKSDLS